MALQAAFTLFTYLLLIQLSRPLSGCWNQRAADNFYCNGSVYIEDSLVKFRWNCQNEMRIVTIYMHPNCTDNGVMRKTNCGCYDTHTVGSFKVLEVSKATLNTTCTFCWHYKYLNDSRTKYDLQTLNFSFAAYCANKTYDITPSVQLLTIPSNSVGCFSCSLPGGVIPNRWSYDDVIISESSYLNGILLVWNTSKIYSNSIQGTILTCNDTVSMNFLQARIIFKASVLPTQTRFISDGTMSSIWPSPSSAFNHQEVSNNRTSTSSPGELTTEQVGIFMQIGITITTTYSNEAGTVTPIKLATNSAYANEGEMSSSAFHITSTPFMQDNNVKVVIGTSFLMLLLVFLIAALLVISIKICKFKKDVVDLNEVVSEHLEFRPQLVHATSVTTQLDKLEWEHPTAPCNSITSFHVDSLSLSECNAISDGAQPSMQCELCRSDTECSYLKVNNTFNIPSNFGHEALQPLAPLQQTIGSNPLENYTLALCTTNDTSYEGQVPINHSHAQNAIAVLNSHSGYIPDGFQSPSVTNAFELLSMLPEGHFESHTSDEIHSSNMEEFFGSLNSLNDTPC